jgi:DNA-binding transcriptional MocR family regulator
MRQGGLPPGDLLPPIRHLAAQLGVSRGTAAAAYRVLQARGLISSDGRRGTRVIAALPVPPRVVAAVPEGARNLALGNPDPSLLPRLSPFLERLHPSVRLFGEQRNLDHLLDVAAKQFQAGGIPDGPVAVVSGALDGLERILHANLRPGDKVSIEDPGYTPILHLVTALGLIAEPIGVDDAGPLPDDLEESLRNRAGAVILTPRAHNPTGGALDAARSKELRTVLQARPDVLVIENDHAGPISGMPAVTLCTDHPNWAIIRSVSKSLGPDLRLAVVTGDVGTISRVEARQQLGAGWVSHILQRLVTALWTDSATRNLLERAAATYSERRAALIAALARRGIEGHGRSGLNVWIPVSDESSIVELLLEAGWAVMAGERFRIRSRPGIRISIATLKPSEAERLAEDFAKSLGPQEQTRLG